MICSFIPGRIRLRSPRFKNADSISFVINSLKEQPGICKVENNLNTGSVLIHYNPEKIDQQAALNALALLGEDEPLFDDNAEIQSGCACAAPRRPRINKEAVEYFSMLSAFIICTSSAFLRSKGLHVYSGLTLAGLTVQHVFKYRKYLQAIFSSPFSPKAD